MARASRLGTLKTKGHPDLFGGVTVVATATKAGGRPEIGATRARGPAARLARHGPYLLGVGVLAFYVCWPLLRLHPWGGHDAGFYPPRYVEFYHLLRSGQLPPRWAPDFSYGYGEPFFNFNPPLVYLLNALLQGLGATFIAAECFSAIALTVVAGLGMYALASAHFGPRGGLASSAAYLTAPYLLVVLYVRHSMPDYAAFAFLPFAFWGVLRYAASGRARYCLVGAAGSALLVLSSNPIALVALPALALGLLFLAWQERRRVAALARGGWCLALGLGLSAFFWLPAYIERGLVHTERLIFPGYLSYWNHFVYPWQLVWSPWGYGASVPGPGDGMSFSIGVAHLAGAGLALTLGVRLLWHAPSWRRRGTLLVPLAIGGALLVGGAWLTTDASRPIWDHVTILQYLQFPWRLLSLAVVGTALLAGAPFAAGRPVAARRRSLPIILLSGVIVAMAADTWGHAQPNPDSQPNPALLALTPAQIARSGKSVDLEGEFEPRWLTVEPYRSPASPVDVTRGAATIRIERDEPTRLDFVVSATTAARLRVNIHYFQGWTVVAQGTVLPISVSAPDDLMVLDVPPGAHQYTLEFRDTPIRRLANGVSLVTLFLLLIAPFWSCGRAKGYASSSRFPAPIEPCGQPRQPAP